MRIVSTRARSVFEDDPAAEFIDWLARLWRDLSPDEQATAAMEVRPFSDGVMVGLRWTEAATPPAEGDDG